MERQKIQITYVQTVADREHLVGLVEGHLGAHQEDLCLEDLLAAHPLVDLLGALLEEHLEDHLNWERLARGKSIRRMIIGEK